MTTLEQHEVFEIEVLNALKSGHLLNPLVFGGGTMLRLCYGLNRYSVDLDFWFVREMDYNHYQNKISDKLKTDYEVVDNQVKHNTLLLEIRSAIYPKKLKIEIRKYKQDFDNQDMIAYTQHSTIQVMLRVHTLEQTMKNKLSAFLDRVEIRDAFDIEFLLRKGVKLPALSDREKSNLIAKITNFKDSDFKVKLGSILDSELRNYYIQNRFQFLQSFL
ncbi:MAG: nucleotidyl transferase AbiEii/AbiGii toxin family protein [Calditrichaceae bacterium]|nr:nucleotidyl transferase AbiEii/AbiGii toxin family protein [Calditrichaceae bacterium]